jgi:hypothetical protein
VQRTAPKAALQADPLLRYQYGLAREMGMTLKRLVAELGPGEIAYQIAYDELETDARSKRAEQARRVSTALQRR